MSLHVRELVRREKKYASSNLHTFSFWNYIFARSVANIFFLLIVLKMIKMLSECILNYGGSPPIRELCVLA